MLPVILLNIGNTRTQLARVNGGRPSAIITLTTDGLVNDPLLLHVLTTTSPGPCAVACVVPTARRELENAFPERDFIFISTDQVASVDFSLVDATTIGADRVANAAAAVAAGQLPLIILDCGTAITIEAIDRHHRFCGGVILPGRRLLRRALHLYTGQLPEVAMTDDCPPALGTTTVGAIRAGLDRGVLGTVERLLNDTRQALNEVECPVLTIGGDADFFCRHLPGIERGPENFTLTGILAGLAGVE